MIYNHLSGLLLQNYKNLFQKLFSKHTKIILKTWVNVLTSGTL